MRLVVFGCHGPSEKGKQWCCTSCELGEVEERAQKANDFG